MNIIDIERCILGWGWFGVLCLALISCRDTKCRFAAAVTAGISKPVPGIAMIS